MAGRVREAVDSFASAHLNMRADREFIEGCDPAQRGLLMVRGIDPAHRAILVTNWSHLGQYEVSFGGIRPAFFCYAPSLMHVPWAGVLFKGFDGDGYVYSVAVPSAVAERIRETEAVAVLHRFRESADEVPPRAQSLPSLV
jgi:hypothetical protein